MGDPDGTIGAQFGGMKRSYQGGRATAPNDASLRQADFRPPP